ncbi:alpha/beta fold hydrolase [Hymenobacter rubripertinctus]|uniref:Alpha/beta fold hydrolase n=1 Tax=Hymenobacter rubripertinctus TaxID=2029981 RepID=A0A418QX67_9BACT|nr:alpha/beta fold hydrolase [Hymenobacter rubripertinctus]RIY09767.1 alpha/beta fold hydrolase [Hymenobacter rubripertinctus]
MKQPLLLLHGALASAAQLKPLARDLGAHYAVHTFSFGGHGGQPLGAAGFSMDQLAAEVLAFLDARELAAAHVFGYSMGGYAALVAALQAPARFRSITTLGTKFDWAPETVAAETSLLDAETMRAKVPGFAAHLEQLHAPTPLPDLLAATASLLRNLGSHPRLTPENLATLPVPTQVLVGELDTTAGVDASRRFAGYLPRATFEVIQNTSHPLEKVNPDLLARRISHCIETAP